MEFGIFPSYGRLESYLPEENWAYTHALMSDATPYYFFGLRGQIFLTRRVKLELWLVNGWQTFGQWHEARAATSYLISPRPSRPSFPWALPILGWVRNHFWPAA